MSAPGRSLVARHWRWGIAVPGAVVVVAVIAAALLESDLVPDFARVAGLGMRAITRLGVPASLAGLYLEESGVPVPISGDFLVLYLGHLYAGAWPQLALAWLGVVAAVVAGSTNLYLISRRWGRRLAEGRLGLVLHLTPERLATAERWFDRWGAPALFFGRHIFGLRVPITVAAGVLRVPYVVFVLSVASSTAIWAAVWLFLGVTFGHQLAGFVGRHHWAYVLPLAGLLGLFVGSLLLRARRQRVP